MDGVGADLVGDLRAAIALRRSTDESAPSLNVGGWKSGEHLFSWREPAISILRSEILRVLGPRVGSGRLVGWAMVNAAGSLHPRHRHDGASWSGVYYVDPGSESSSPTIFETSMGEVVVEPRRGRLVTFRSDTWHRVPPCRGEAERVTIAFDVRR